MSYQANSTIIINDTIDILNLNDVSANSISGSAISSESEAAAGTVDNKVLTPLRVRNALAVTGSAPIYAARAWVSFSATTPVSGTPTIIGSGNISSITDLGAGYFRANFTTAMPDAIYNISGSTSQVNVDRIVDSIGPRGGYVTASSFEFYVRRRIVADSAATVDPAHASLVVYR